MSIRKPRFNLTELDRKLIKLIGSLLLSKIDKNVAASNVLDDDVLLSEEEASDLLFLLGRLIKDRTFLERLSFIENVGLKHVDDRMWGNFRLKKSGKTTALSSTKWADFRIRIGHEVSWHPNVTATRMDFEHFYEMENLLFKELDIHPKVRGLVMDFISINKNTIENVRNNRKNNVNIISEMFSPVMKFLDDKIMNRGGVLLRTNALAGIMSLVSNGSVLFTTRDWDVTGTISGVASYIIAVYQNKD